MPLTFLERRCPFVFPFLFLFLFGCAERPQPAAPPSPAEREAFAARVLAARDQAHQQAATRAAAARPVVWPAPVPTPTGGQRIDLRGIPDHIHTLERQPDGTWRSFCRDPRQVTTGSGQ
jgi:hypothetical protein